jgi:DNA-binding MarR family transcriptional regulator
LAATEAGPTKEDADATPDIALIELMFFAYRDFVGEPDRVLERYGFGRAHHRVLHFVSRHPGLTIAALLDILKITKQSLARVLKDLVEEGFIDSRAGADDRRQRLLHLTAKGSALAGELMDRQGRRIAEALRQVGPEGREPVRRFLLGLIDPGLRDHICSMIPPGPR